MPSRAAHAPASLLAIVNATSPMFGLAWSAAFGDERLTARKAAGLRAGRRGRRADRAARRRSGPTPSFGWAVAAALAACLRLRLDRRADEALRAPACARAAWPPATSSLRRWCCCRCCPSAPPPAALGAGRSPTCSPSRCSASGVAFVLYFRLIADVGATRALTVTYLIPLFGVLWGWLFLGEALPGERARRRCFDSRRNGAGHAQLELEIGL